MMARIAYSLPPGVAVRPLMSNGKTWLTPRMCSIDASRAKGGARR
jgi:hypothetical protein